MGLTFVDLFCGIGTIRMGMEMASHTCTYSVEWDKHKRKIYSIIFGKEPEGADIREVLANDIPVSDVWCFGAPCQDFSIAGKRAGLEGERSSLVSEVFRLIRETPEEHRPKYILYENVKGMLSSNKGFDYLEILYQMDSLGYDTERELLDSKNFGVPQHRERVFTIGHLRTKPWTKVFPLGGGDQVSTEGKGEGAVEDKDITSAITKNYAKGVHSGGETYIKCVGNLMPSGSKNNSVPGIVYDIEGISPCLRTPTGGKTTPIITEFTYLRRLTPKECWRLQGISDKTIDKVAAAEISDTQMYRGAGDACTVNVVYEIAKKLT